eukprot:1004961-Prymnesium_polylepis.1
MQSHLCTRQHAQAAKTHDAHSKAAPATKRAVIDGVRAMGTVGAMGLVKASGCPEGGDATRFSKAPVEDAREAGACPCGGVGTLGGAGGSTQGVEVHTRRRSNEQPLLQQTLSSVELQSRP